MAKEKAAAKVTEQSENKEAAKAEKTKKKKASDAAGTEDVNSEKAEGKPEEETPEEAEGAEAAAPEEEKEDADTQYMRLMADFQNYKKRVEKEKGDIYAFANEKILSDMLDVIDNFERALSQKNDAGEGFMDGMNMIFKQMMGVLEKYGLEEIDALGKEFDVNFHNAVMTEATDEYESGTVSAVLQKGFTLNKKVVRPAMVKVAQ
ncbi:MAG: nucleotide exchange factor GrpE [Clostridia bacterium]|nr:nucleotide exchange factor GrpE [Clostridia bacterium]